jgi:hypothetical protein
MPTARQGRGAGAVERLECQPLAHVDHRDDATAQIEQARDLGRRQRHPRQPLRHEHVLDALDRQPEQLATDHRGDVFDDVLSGRSHGAHPVTPPGSGRRSAP